MDIVLWLRSLGLEKYEAVFRENEIDERSLPNLPGEDLKDLYGLWVAKYAAFNRRHAVWACKEIRRTRRKESDDRPAHAWAPAHGHFFGSDGEHC